MKKTLLNLGAGLLVTSLVTAALAAGDAKKMEPKMATKMAPKTSPKMAPKGKTTQMTATISKIAGDKLTVMPTAAGKKAVATIVTVPAGAKIMMGSKTVKESDLKMGEKVTFMMSGGTVTKVMVHGASMAKMSAKNTSKTASKMMPKKM